MSSAHEVRMSLALALSLLTSCLLSAQYLNRRDPKTPRLPDGKPVVFHFSAGLPITPAFEKLSSPPSRGRRLTRRRASNVGGPAIETTAKRLQRP